MHFQNVLLYSNSQFSRKLTLAGDVFALRVSAWLNSACLSVNSVACSPGTLHSHSFHCNIVHEVKFIPSSRLLTGVKINPLNNLKNVEGVSERSSRRDKFPDESRI